MSKTVPVDLKRDKIEVWDKKGKKRITDHLNASDLVTHLGYTRHAPGEEEAHAESHPSETSAREAEEAIKEAAGKEAAEEAKTLADAEANTLRIKEEGTKGMREGLVALAEAQGIKVDKRWGVEKLSEALGIL